ncbi:MAG: helix-turn-helix domain-containing protein [Acutalibacteraceae bacterium]
MKSKDYAKISSDNIRLLIIQHEISIRQLAEIIGVAPTTLNDSLKSKKGVAIDSLIRIADYFNLTVNDLCDSDFFRNNPASSSKSNYFFIQKFNSLDDYGKELVSLVIDKELERVTEQNSNF